ncbi:WD40 repeat domain-containing protein, partial [Avibacterium volantium]|uniref:WD40 repeat domain-containing protein n=1 Tax=Avibacterium volantium TaxID=762 RepID=UPI003BF771E0
ALSAIFIPNSHEFMWQDEKDIIYTQNVEGKIITQFQHPFTVQNHRITADKTFYLSADYNNDLYLGYGENMKTIYNDGASIGKPVDLSIVGNLFLSVTGTCHRSNELVAETNLTTPPINPSSSKKSSYKGVTLWDKNSLKPIAKLYGNCGETTGLISPDGKWIVASGENERDYMWELHNLNNRQRLARLDVGIYREKTDSYDESLLLPIPDKFKSKTFGRNNTVSIAFLTEKDFILLGNSHEIKNYRKSDELARLFTVGDPWIKGYVEIGNNPSISTNYFQRNLSVSSSPSAHILVTGQAT